jgi:hypothetical protein
MAAAAILVFGLFQFFFRRLVEFSFCTLLVGLVVFGQLVQKLWRSIDFSFRLENAYSPENYPIFGVLYPQDEIFSDIFVQKAPPFTRPDCLRHER